MGTPPFAAVALRRLLSTHHRLAAVVSQPDRRAGRGRKLTPSAVKQVALEHDLEILQPERAGDPDFIARLGEIAPDLAVVVAYGRILPKRTLAVPRLGCINAHGSVLPALRGAAPIQHAILEGRASTGVTIMQINERMDAGDMLLCEEIAIEADDDTASLGTRLATLGADLLVRAIDDIATGTARAVAQDESLATYAPPIHSEDALIRWDAPAVSIERRVRALRPRPGAFTYDSGRRLKLLRTAVRELAGDAPVGTLIAEPGRAMMVACGEGALELIEVQPEGRKAMTGADYLRGCGEAVDRRLGEEPAAT